MNRTDVHPKPRFSILGLLQVTPSFDALVHTRLDAGLAQYQRPSQPLSVELPPSFCVGKHDFAFSVSGLSLPDLDKAFYDILNTIQEGDNILTDYTKVHLTELSAPIDPPQIGMPPIAVSFVKLAPSAQRPRRLVSGIAHAKRALEEGVRSSSEGLLSARVFVSFGLHEVICLFYGHRLREVSVVLELLIKDRLVQFCNTVPLIEMMPPSEFELLRPIPAYKGEGSTLGLDLLMALAPGSSVGEIADQLLANISEPDFALDYRFGSYDVSLATSTNSLQHAYSWIRRVRSIQNVIATASGLKLPLESGTPELGGQ